MPETIGKASGLVGMAISALKPADRLRQILQVAAGSSGLAGANPRTEASRLVRECIGDSRIAVIIGRHQGDGMAVKLQTIPYLAELIRFDARFRRLRASFSTMVLIGGSWHRRRCGG
jgi:hypothetical protein